MKRFYRNTFSIMLLAGGLTLSLNANAQSTLVNFTFTGAVGNEVTFAPDAQPANATVTDMTRGTGVAVPATGGANVFTATSWPWATAPAPPALPNAPLETDAYFSFTITPDAGFELDLDSLYFLERRSSTGPRTWAVRSSLDGFTADIATMDVPDDTNNRTHGLGLSTAFQDLTTPVEFRFYGYNAEADGGTWRLDNVKLVGAIPPSGPATSVSFVGNAATVAEDVGTTSVQVSIANPNATTPTTVDVVVTGGSATAGTDFTYTTQTITFPAGSSAAQAITLNIADDNDVETDETITLELQNASTGVVLGTSSFTITITDNDTPPPAVPLVTIAAATQFDATTGIATMLGQTVRVRGINYGVNQRPAGIQWTIIDNTGGIGLFRTTGSLGYTFAEGDSIEVQGTIAQFNGLTQLNVDSLWLLTTNNPLQAPTVVTALGENTESELVRLANPVTIVDPTDWTGSGSGFSVDVTDGTNTYVMRIDNDVNLYGMTMPMGWFYLTGIGGQFDSSNPHLEGYQLLPRSAADLQYVPSLMFASLTDSVNENAGSRTVTLNIMNPGAAASTVQLVAVGGTATAGTDFTYTTQTVNFAAGSTTPQTVTVTILDDTQVEGDETIEFALQNASTGTIVEAGNLILTIVDNDPNAVAENIEKNSLAIYPNPAAAFAMVSMEDVTGAAQVQLINGLGQLVSSQATEGAAAVKLNLNALAAGMYTVRVITAEAVKTGAVVKH